MSSPTPPPPLPDPDDDLPRRAPRRRSAAPSSSRDAARRHPSAWSRLSPRAWAILVAVVAIVLVLIIGAVAGGSGKEKKSEIKTDSAVSALQSLLDGVDKDTALGSCPFGSVASIAGDVRGEVKVSGEVTDGMHKIVIGGKDSVDEVLCSASTADDRIHPTQSMYVYATPAPKGSYTDYLTKTLLADAEVKLEDPVKFGGGTVYAWCVTPAPDSKGGCGADWVAGDNKLVLGMQLANDRVTAKQITAALEHELETLANRLGGDQATGTTVPGTADGTDVTTGGSGPVTTVDRTSTPSTVADGTTVDQPVTGSVRT